MMQNPRPFSNISFYPEVKKKTCKGKKRVENVAG
jgi:hypothetical protein